MAVGLQQLAIVLDSADNTFSPGEIVAGRVVIELGRPKSIRGLKIQLKGNGEVKWSETTGTGDDRKTEWDVRTEEYFRMEFYLLGGVGNSQRVEMEKGYHVFPFNFSLPHNIPSSFEHKLGYVRYTIKAVLDRPWKFDHQTSMTFTVEAPYDLSKVPASRLGIEEEEDDTFCCFSCFNMGSMSLNISVPASGFAVGEAITAKFDINNTSTSVDVTGIHLQLKQKIKFQAHRSSRTDSNIVQKVDKMGPFNKRDTIVMGMQVPAVPLSTFPHSRLIDIEYQLVVQVAVSVCHCNTDRVYPIIIGSRPAANNQQTQNAHAFPVPVQDPLIQLNAPSAPFFGTEEPTSTTTPYPVPFPEKPWKESSGPTPYPPNPPYGFAAANQSYPPPMPDSATGSSFQYPPAGGSALGFVYPVPGPTTTEKPPPSYDDTIKTETKK